MKCETERLDLTAYLTLCKSQVDAAIDGFLRETDRPEERLVQAMRYALLGGGKRLRPALVLLACESVGGRAETALPAAAAIEMIHTYSLVHDDLPCMDDDDYRRGRLTVHRQYDEATAVLTGDALHALAFEILAEHGGAQVVREVAHEIGTAGILGGQMDDLLAEGLPATLEQVSFIHLRKTASLFTASVRAGGIIGGASDEHLTRLSRYGHDIGLAFQIVDDILDEVSSTEQLGKPAGSDRERRKATYPAVAGLEASRARARELADSAKLAVKGIPFRKELFEALADYVVTRDH